MRIVLAATVAATLTCVCQAAAQDRLAMHRLPATHASYDAESPQPPLQPPGDVPTRLPPFDTPAIEYVEPLQVTPSPPDVRSEPWWQSEVVRPFRNADSGIFVDTNSLLVDTLQHSARVRAISENAIVAETAVAVAKSAFDVHAFMESKFCRTSVPTGSTLDAGFNVPRLRQEDWNYKGGSRKRNQFGGTAEFSQQIGTRDSNSVFFLPPNQGNSRLTLSYTQPLLNGAGKAYNQSLIVLADLDTSITSGRAAEELQDSLLDVTVAMWELYIQRSFLLQKQRHLQRGQEILARLESRRGFDALDSQIVRARAAVATRRTEMIRAETAIRNSEAQLRALVNSPIMLADRSVELVPVQAPTSTLVPIDLQGAMQTALTNRTEIDAAAKEIEAARVRLNVSKKELLPALDLVLETYASGLRGDYDIGQSLTDQLSRGEPSYSAGLLFDVPIQRRAAFANERRRHAELRQLTSRFQATLEVLHADIEIAVREIGTSFAEMEAKHESMLAAETDARYFERRWEELPGDDRSASFLLEDLFDAQDRLVHAESEFGRAQVTYTLSLTRLNRAMGTLFKSEQIESPSNRTSSALPTPNVNPPNALEGSPLR